MLAGANLTVSGVTLTGGVAVPFAPGAAAHGGAILDNAGGSLTLTGVTITDNRASGTGGYGGAIEVFTTSGAIALTNSTVTNNRAGASPALATTATEVRSTTTARAR